MNTSEPQNTESASRPFGYWLKAADRLMAAEFAAAFEAEGASRRDWRLLELVDGEAPADSPLPRHRLEHLVDRGWIVADGDGWTLTEEGRTAKERLGALVDGIRAKVTDAVSPEDLDTTLASLESIARAFGWDEQTRLPRGRGRREDGRGRFDWRRLARLAHLDPSSFGHGGHEHPRDGFGSRDFGPRDFGPRSFGRPGFGPDHGADHGYGDEHPRHAYGSDHHGHAPHARPHHGGHGPHPARLAQHAYERGFDAGFARGRDA